MAAAGGAASATDNSGASNQGPPSGPRGDGNRGRGRGRGGSGGGGGRGRGEHGRGGGGGGRGRNRGRGGNAGAQPGNSGGDAHAAQTSKPPAFKARQEPPDESDNADSEVCFICANRIIHHSVAPCNHITCHICALRLRALYKSKDCPHCRTEAPFVIFTDDATKRFEDYTNENITSTDDNIGIKYAGEEIVGDTVLLLRYNCPESDCDFAGLGWPDLHRHVRSVHHKKMCDLCTRHKKVFTHEHDMFSDKDLQDHMRHGDDKPGAVDQTGFKGHPLCSFCGERFYDDDKLYEHCRNKHERCFICDRRDSRQPHYYLDYNALERHFRDDHFMCMDRECVEKKFVVFESELDLKAHQLSEHGNSLSKDVRRDARVVDMAAFDFRAPYQQERGAGGSSRGNRGRENRGRGRDPNAEPLPVSSAQPLRRDELAFQRQMAIHSAPSVAPRTFGGQLTSSAPTPRTNGNNPSSDSQTPAASSATSQNVPIIDAMESLTVTDLSTLTPDQRASLTRHGAVIERASNLLSNDASKVASFRSYISSYNRASMTAEQLIDAFFALFAETSSTALGTLVREVSDLFDDKKKGEALRKAWQNWRAVNEDYPSLPGLGGMHGATTASSGWAAAASASPTATQGQANAAAQARASTRVLRLKNSTRRGSVPTPGQTVVSVGASSSGGSSAAPRTQMWGNDPPLAPSSAAFPSLPSTRGGAQRAQPSWIGGNASGGVNSRISSMPAPAPSSSASRAGGGTAAAAPKRTADAFPALPAAPKPQTTIFGYGRGAVRREFGASRDTGFSWGGGGNEDGSSSGAAGTEGQDVEGGGGGGKGKKGKKKQVLVQWG